MGFLKSANELRKQAKELSKNWDPAAQMAQAQERMTLANEMLLAQTAAAGLAITGTDAAATVVAAKDAGEMLNMQPVLDADLMVTPVGEPPFPVKVRQPVMLTQLAAMTPGARLRVKYDPADRSKVWIDFTSVG